MNKRPSISEMVRQNVEDGGPTRRDVLAHFAERHGAKDGSLVVDGLVGSGELVMVGKRRGTKYATPEQAKALAAPPKPKTTKVIQG